MRQLCIRVAMLGSLAFVSSLTLLACSGSDAARVAAIADLKGDTAQGKPAYESSCKTCHGSDGKGAGGSVKRNVASVAHQSPNAAIDQILSGSDEMPSFSNLSDQKIADIVAYLGSLN